MVPLRARERVEPRTYLALSLLKSSDRLPRLGRHLVARTPQRTPTRTPHTAPAHEPVRKRISKASSTSETIEFGAGKRGAQKSQASRR